MKYIIISKVTKAITSLCLRRNGVVSIIPINHLPKHNFRKFLNKKSAPLCNTEISWPPFWTDKSIFIYYRIECHSVSKCGHHGYGGITSIHRIRWKTRSSTQLNRIRIRELVPAHFKPSLESHWRSCKQTIATHSAAISSKYNSIWPFWHPSTQVNSGTTNPRRERQRQCLDYE